jgi:hypothetical protein
MRTLIGVAVHCGRHRCLVERCKPVYNRKFGLAGCACPFNISLECNFEGLCNVHLGNTQSSARGQFAGWRVRGSNDGVHYGTTTVV